MGIVLSSLVYMYYKSMAIKDAIVRRKRYDKKKMTRLKDVKTFFVGMYYVESMGKDIMLRTIANLFHTAAYPLRINVGIIFYNVENINLKDQMEQFGRPYYSTNINIIYKHYDCKGTSFARWEIENELYHGEDYIVFLSPGIQIVDGWDMIIQEKMNINDVWTSVPIETFQTNQGTWNPVIDRQKGGLITFDTSSAVRVLPSIRICFKEWNGGIPIYDEFENENVADNEFITRSIHKDFFVIHKSKFDISYPIEKVTKGKVHIGDILQENDVLYEFFITNLLLYNDIKIKSPGYAMVYSSVSTRKTSNV